MEKRERREEEEGEKGEKGERERRWGGREGGIVKENSKFYHLSLTFTG